MESRRHFLHLVAASTASLAMPGVAQAETWPSHNIRAVIPFSAGSSVDVIGRIVLDALSQELAQPIVVENRGGAGGTIGTAVVARADADGYTVLVDGAAHSATPAAYSNLSFDPVHDFASVIPFGSVPNVLVVKADGPIKSIQDFLAEAKTKTMTYSSAGVGSTTHWAAERLRVSAGFKGVHVPFRGGPEALTEVITGRVDFACMGMGSALSLIHDKKLLPLAVSLPKRSRALPDVPTTLEAGLADSDYVFWVGMFVPAKTPRPIVDRLYDATRKVLARPDVQDKFKPQGIEPLSLTPKEFDALIEKEVAGNIAFVKKAGLKFN